MVNIILTLDYELFFGKLSGSVNNCLIVPTEKLIEVINLKYSSHFTIFWDVLHYLKMKEYEDKYGKLKNDRINVENQIKKITSLKNDVQLHVHPHWVNSVFEDKWIFDHENYKIDLLNDTDDANNLNTISGCINIAKNEIEKICTQVEPNYRVFAYRAGGWNIQPFGKISKYFRKYNINVDSSVITGVKFKVSPIDVDFSQSPTSMMYKFNDDILTEEDNGFFTEVAISSLKKNGITLLNQYLKNKLYKNNRRKIYGDGITITKTRQNNLNYYWEKILRLNRFIKGQTVPVSLESFHVDYPILLKKFNNKTINMIGHPKGICPKTISVLDKLLKNNKIRIISLTQYLLEK